MVICNYLTKWPEAFVVSNQKAPTIAKLLVEEIFCQFEIPLCLFSDKGTNFLSSIMKEVLKILAVQKVHTSSYHPQTDGLVERFNCTLIDMLGAYVSENQKDWDLHLPYILFVYCTSQQASTGKEPFVLMFG